MLPLTHQLAHSLINCITPVYLSLCTTYQNILLFNPPYVPTSPSELHSDGIERSWAGGLRGREVLDRLMPQVDGLLAADGVWYCVLVKENEPDEVCATMMRQGWESETVKRRKAGREDLQIVKFYRTPPLSADI